MSTNIDALELMAAEVEDGELNLINCTDWTTTTSLCHPDYSTDVCC